MSAQLPLAVRWPEPVALADFVAGANGEALAAVWSNLEGRPPAALLLQAPRGRGKSMLLQGAAREVLRRGGRAAYLALGLPGLDAAALQGLETLDWIALDEIEQTTGRAALCNAIVRFIDARRGAGLPLALALGETGPSGLSADLQTRLRACARFPLHPLGDDELVEVLRRRAQARGLEMSEDVARFIVRREPRDLPRLLELLGGLDRESLSAQRRLTIPFVQQWLAARGGANARTAAGP